MTTPTTPPALRAYRTRHRVVVVRDWSEDFGRFVPVCETDGIRVYARRNGAYRHDSFEIAQLAAFERGWQIGDPVDWR